MSFLSAVQRLKAILKAIYHTNSRIMEDFKLEDCQHSPICMIYDPMSWFCKPL